MMDSLVVVDSLNAFAETSRVVIDTTFVIKETAAASGSSSWLTGSNLTEILVTLMVLAKVIINITPTEKDNKVFGLVDSVLNAIIPSRIKSGNGGNAKV